MGRGGHLRGLIALGLLASSILGPTAAGAQERPSRTLFGPVSFTRTAGPPTTEIRIFSVPFFIIPPFHLHLENGAPDGTQRISSGRVFINGTQIIGPNDFNQQVATILWI